MMISILLFLIFIVLLHVYNFATVKKEDVSILSSSPNDLKSKLKISQHSIDPEVRQLRLKGMDYLMKKKYHVAAKYYMATLQLMQGLSGEETGNMRRRCALTLAECEMKSGKLHQAIITCTEIIDESPDISIDLVPAERNASLLSSISSSTLSSTSSSLLSSSLSSSSSSNTEDMNLLRKVLGKAYYKRGLSLEKLNLNQLALKDYKMASFLTPDDRKIRYRMELLTSGNYSIDIIPSNLASNLTSSSTEIFDFVESILQHYPKITLSKNEIKRLSTSTITSEKTSSFLPTTFGAESELNGLHSMANMFGMNSISGIIGMVGGMMGLPSKSITLCQEVIEELWKAGKMYVTIIKSLLVYRTNTLSVITAIWIVVFLFNFPVQWK